MTSRLTTPYDVYRMLWVFARIHLQMRARMHFKNRVRMLRHSTSWGSW